MCADRKSVKTKGAICKSVLIFYIYHMENYNSNSEIFNLQVDEVARANMLEMARWTKFLSIVGFIGLGLLAMGGIAMLFSTAIIDSMGYGALGTSVALIYLVLVALYFYPTYALFKFANTVKPAIRTANQAQFNEALGHLKGVFKFVGIFTIIIIGIYGLIFIFAIIGAAVAGV